MSTARLAAFVSPHGFGHAARTCAVIEALARRQPSLEVDLYTTVPEWFFTESISVPFARFPLACDVGLAQRSALDEDPGATASALERLWPPAPALLAELATQLRRRSTRLVLCDMAALGVAAARHAGLPAALVENFTWSFIYHGYRDEEPRLAGFSAAFDAELATAAWRFRVEPSCGEGAGVDVPPVARQARATREAVRARLGVAPDRPMVLVSMGGIPWSFAADSLAAARTTAPGASPLFVVPGGAEVERRDGDLLLLPHHSPIHHPDLVAAADALVGKLGYSTVAEAARAGTRFAYLPRPRFRESPVLAAWLSARLPTVELPPTALADGSWAAPLADLLARGAGQPTLADGAETIAAALAAAFE